MTSNHSISLLASSRLESLRGLAALTVALFHCFLLMESSPHSGQRFVPLAIKIFNGRSAVTVFFVLSGLVLGLSLRRSTRPMIENCAAYLIRRVFRIYPAFLMATLVVAAVIPLYRHLPPTDSNWTNTYFPPTYTLRELVQNLAFYVHTFSRVTWTLKMEMICSILLPVCYYGSRIFKPTPWLLLLVVMVLAHRFTTVVSIDVMQAFLIGYLIPETRGIWEKINGNKLLTFLAFVVSLPLLSLMRSSPLELSTITIAESVGALLLISAVTYGADLPVFSVLDWHPTKVAGQTSYSYYLLQPIVLIPLTSLLFPTLQAAAGYHFSVGCGVLMWIASTLVTIPLAWLSYKFLERPMIAFSKSLMPHQRGHPLASEAPGRTPDSINS